MFGRADYWPVGHRDRGEQAATNMEANLSRLESKLDAILAGLEAAESQGGAKAAEGAPEQRSTSRSDSSTQNGETKEESK